MTGNELFPSAAALCCENSADEGTALLLTRFLPLLDAGCRLLRPLDLVWRRDALGEDVSEAGDYAVTALSAALPLSDRLLPVLAYYAAAALTADENPSLSASLRTDLADAERAVRQEIPAHVSAVRDVYGNMSF